MPKTPIALRRLLAGSTAMAALVALHAAPARAQGFIPGDLIVSSTTYVGSAATVTVGQNLPTTKKSGAAIQASDNGVFGNVFNNGNVDGSFGVTSPLFLDNYRIGGTTAAPTATLQSTLSVTSLAGVVTSFASKSEGALSVSPDGQNLTLIDYKSTVNQLDISNSNSPGITEPGNRDLAPATPRTIVNFNAAGTVTAVLPTNAYDGNNGRAAINVNGTYYLAGNAGNGSGSPATTLAAGIQTLNPATATMTNGAYNTTQTGSFDASKPPSSLTGDKTAKDNNYRSLTVFDNTLYTTKGSGGNGVNTVYQVGSAGTLPTTGAAITILPGLPTTGTATTSIYPFATYFANANTLYVADEGAGSVATAGTLAAADLAAAAADPYAGLQKYSLVGGVWTLDYTLQAGLGLGSSYTVSGTDFAGDSGSYTAGTDGLRSLAARDNGDGTLSFYAVTSTISGGGDLGADPNMLVTITDNLANISASGAGGEKFTTLQTSAYGQVLRGVAFTPVPEPASMAVFSVAMAGLGAIRRRRNRRR